LYVNLKNSVMAVFIFLLLFSLFSYGFCQNNIPPVSSPVENSQSSSSSETSTTTSSSITTTETSITTTSSVTTTETSITTPSSVPTTETKSTEAKVDDKPWLKFTLTEKAIKKLPFDIAKLNTLLNKEFSKEDLTRELNNLNFNKAEIEEILNVAEEKDPRWFKTERTNMLVAIFLLSGFILFFIYSAQKGTELFVRRIAGLSALDDAVGRATEMGKAVLFIPGIMDMDDIQTLAGLSILSYVAQKTAEYDTPIMVPTSRSLVMSTAQEIVKESYMRVGRPDAFRPDNIRYLTDDQFGFVAGVDGIMVREKPAANFYMGCFYAESLILAETGHSTGAIQMAGTAMPSQLPLFVAACDYTLMGEELYAASAYLSRDPQQLGSLKGQDVCKIIILLCILFGSLMSTAGFKFFLQLFETK